MITVGYLLAEKGWFNPENSRLIARLVTRISLPGLMIWNLTSSFDRENLLGLSYGLGVPLVTILGSCVIGILLAKLIRIPKNKQGVFIAGSFGVNTIFVGLPVNLALFGPESLPYALLFYIANTCTFWTLGTYYISTDGNGPKHKFLSLDTLKSFFSPPMLACLAGLFLVLTNTKLPPFLLDTCKYLGNMTTPLAMLFIGVAIHDADIKELKLSKDMLAMFISRFAIGPAIVFLLALIFPLPVLMKKVFVIQAAMPIMTNLSIMAAAYGADARYAAVLTSATILLSMAVIPLYMVIL